MSKPVEILEVIEFAEREDGQRGVFKHAILHSPVCGPLYVANGKITDSMPYSWEEGFLALLLVGDTLESLQAEGSGMDGKGTILDDIHQGMDPDRPIVTELSSEALAKLAENHGL